MKLKLSAFSNSSENSQGVSMLFGGDFCPIGKYAEKILAKDEIFDADLKKLFKESFSMINLEAPLCDENLKAAAPSGVGLRGKPEIADYLNGLGINVAGFANNHTRDFGDKGIIQTIRNLERAGLLHTGAGENLTDAENIFEQNRNGLKIGIWALAEKELNVASESSAGSSWFCPERNFPAVENMKERFDFLVIYLHAGHEFISTPSPRIRKACRAFVDAGADAVIAHHPHVIQGTEKYKNALIAYSLGNLVFDSPYVSAYKNTDLGYLVKLNISKHTINEVEIIPYKLRKYTMVSMLNKDEFDKFTEKFNILSENIVDNLKFYEEWEKNVRFRWETEYRQVLSDFSRNMNDINNKDYAYRSKNLFTCPTHTEMIEKIFLMLEEGKLTRSP